MKIQKGVSLKKYNTFHVDVIANRLITIEDSRDLLSSDITPYLKDTNILFLGRGSNTLFTKDFEGTIFLLRNTGIEIEQEDSDETVVKVNAGVDWNDLVLWSTKANLLGLQNLIDIPGNVGSSPIQNIGAYGVEIKEYIKGVKIYNLEDGKEQILTNEECHFGYRDSVFKNELKGKVVITQVILKLKKYKGILDDRYIEYAGIKEKIGDREVDLNSLLQIVRDIRKEKLPPIEEYGSCGSTFKNLLVDINKYKELEQKFVGLPSFETEQKDIVKIPTAYILDKLGWKNRRERNVGTWIYHPLIVTNYGGASGKEILAFILKMQDNFKEHTGLYLEPEINIF